MKVIQLPGTKPLSGAFSIEMVEAIAETIARLLHPHAEVVLHDLATGKIPNSPKAAWSAPMRRPVQRARG
jgi:hypothetical protein